LREEILLKNAQSIFLRELGQVVLKFGRASFIFSATLSLMTQHLAWHISKSFSSKYDAGKIEGHQFPQWQPPPLLKNDDTLGRVRSQILASGLPFSTPSWPNSPRMAVV
jgi:hypothetical protein